MSQGTMDQAVERQLREIVKLTSNNAKLVEVGVLPMLNRAVWFAENCLLVLDGVEHHHVAGTTAKRPIDECARCGRDFRNPIHIGGQVDDPD